jgi:hypothetical protein
VNAIGPVAVVVCDKNPHHRGATIIRPLNLEP